MIEGEAVAWCLRGSWSWCPSEGCGGFPGSTQRWTSPDKFIEGLLLGSGGLISVSAVLPPAQAFKRLSLLRCHEELAPCFVCASAGLGQFARELPVAFIHQVGIKPRLVQLACPLAGG